MPGFNGYYHYNNLPYQQLFQPGIDPFNNGTADFNIDLNSATNQSATYLCTVTCDDDNHYLIPFSQSLRITACVQDGEGNDGGWVTDQIHVLYNIHKMLAGFCYLNGTSLYRNINDYERPSQICGYVGFAFYKPLDLAKPNPAAYVSFVPFHERGWGHTNELLRGMGGYWKINGQQPPVEPPDETNTWVDLVSPFNNRQWFDTVSGSGITRLFSRKLWEIFRWGQPINGGNGKGTRFAWKIRYVQAEAPYEVKTAYFNIGGGWDQMGVDNGTVGSMGEFSYAYWHMAAPSIYMPTAIQSNLIGSQYVLYSDLARTGNYYPANPAPDDYPLFYKSPDNHTHSTWSMRWSPDGTPGPRYKAAFIRTPSGAVPSPGYPNGYLSRPLILVRRAWDAAGQNIASGEDNWVTFLKAADGMKAGTYAQLTLGVLMGDGINPNDRTLRSNTVFTPLPSVYRPFGGQYGDIVASDPGNIDNREHVVDPGNPQITHGGDVNFDEETMPIDIDVTGMAPVERSGPVIHSVPTWHVSSTYAGFIVHKPVGVNIDTITERSKDIYFNEAQFNERYAYGNGYVYIPDGFSGSYRSDENDSSIKVTITIAESEQ